MTMSRFYFFVYLEYFEFIKVRGLLIKDETSETTGDRDYFV